MLPIGTQLRRLREEKGISQRAMARKTGLQRLFVRRVERGFAFPSIESLEKFARALDVPLWELFYTGEPWKPPRPLAGLPWHLKPKSGRPTRKARYLLKLIPFLARIPEKERGLFLSFAEGLAKHSLNETPL